MATLEEGQNYGLASNDISRGNVTVVHFKLTDSALKALEDFYKVKNGRDQRTTIQFKENQGIINISSHVSSSGNRPQRSYKFSLSSLPEVNGSFDCVQQTNRQGFSSLQSLGSMQYKVAVHATDDIYDSTRAKMNLAEEESKKVCTKEIKPSGPHISKKVKKVIPSSAAFKMLANSNASGKPTHLVKPLPMRHHPHPVSASSDNTKSSNSSPSLSSSISTSSNSTSGKIHPHHPYHNPASSNTSSPSSLSSSKPSVRAPSPSPHLVGSRQSPTPSSLSSGFKSGPSAATGGVGGSSQQGVLTSSSSKPSSSGAINMPYRDRVIHLLALKPYKKPELILRLQKDGIREKDRNSLGSVLQQVATLNKDNSYTLARSAWIDVRQDWPHYSDTDRALLKSLQLDTRSMVTSPAVSPASSNPESPGSSQKRMAEEVEEVAPMPKKKRISHLDRHKVEDRQVGAVKPMVVVQQQSSSPDSNRENQEGSIPADTDLADYCRIFVAIKDRIQRQKYKQEFEKEYGEYRNLHEQVEQVAHRFQGLLSKITATDEESHDYEILKKQAVHEVEAQKADPKFMAKKRRMEYLHQKLGHIKRLIHDFDHQPLPPVSVSS